MTRKKKHRRNAKYTGVLSTVFFACLLLCCMSPAREHGDVFGAFLPRSPTPVPTVRPTPLPTPTPEADIDEGVGEAIRVELLSIGSGDAIDLSGSEPRVLIYHTHTTEAYAQTEGWRYEESGSWRTHDNTRNIVAVGSKLAKLLQEKYGLSVLHDTTDHEPPKLSSSYSRSVLTMEAYKKKYPSLLLFIDVHRDAYGDSEAGLLDYVTINGKPCAKLMCVVGTGEGATGNGFGEMPDFASNYALAKRITETLGSYHPGLARKIRVKTGRYNQHVSNQCLLIEVGHNANTLEQALNSVDHLAAAIAASAGGISASAGGISASSGSAKTPAGAWGTSGENGTPPSVGWTP